MISLVCAKMWAGNRRVGGRGRGNEGQAGWEALLPRSWGEVVQFGLFADGNTAYAVVHPYPHPKWLLFRVFNFDKLGDGTCAVGRQDIARR